ncbi:carbohydrate sulfotransferase 1-like [Palaemon carinicauda]|uniref:carbohydrate sulfotransferase 1-like n=1 Tax=Palaemon carinicauda TaxID=392227 RepID=UPI0035B611F4
MKRKEAKVELRFWWMNSTMKKNEEMEKLGDEEDKIEKKEQEKKEEIVIEELGEKSKILEEKERGFPYNVLLMASTGRSGSSFLGSLLNTQPNVFYIFEPMHDLEKKKMLTRQFAMESLKDIFTCDIKYPILSFFMHKPKFFIKSFYKECGSQKSCLTREAINSRCKTKTIRVVKTIRTRVAWLRSIIDDPEVNLKVIHLVRDPRASLISSWKRGWGISADTSCSKMADDLQNAPKLKMLNPEKYLAVRYEDLCDNPWGLAKKIFAFLGYPFLPPPTIDFLKKSTSSSDQKVFGTNRQTKQMAQKWRSVISADELRTIETACEPVINEIGFRLFGNIEDVRNQSVPLYEKRYENTLFLHDDAS